MKHKEAKDLLFVDRYLAGSLSEEEQTAFEAHILACQACLDELELTDRLSLGFKDAFGQESPEFEHAAAAGARNVLLSPRYATAASVLLAASMLAAGLMYGSQDRYGGPAVAQVFPIHATRSVDAAPTSLLRLASPDAMAVLLVDPGLTDHADYRVHVRRGDAADRSTVTELEGLQPTYEDLLAVTIPAKALPAGDYTIELSGRASPDSVYARVSVLSFRVVE